MKAKIKTKTSLSYKTKCNKNNLFFNKICTSNRTIKIHNHIQIIFLSKIPNNKILRVPPMNTKNLHKSKAKDKRGWIGGKGQWMRKWKMRGNTDRGGKTKAKAKAKKIKEKFLRNLGKNKRVKS